MYSDNYANLNETFLRKFLFQVNNIEPIRNSQINRYGLPYTMKT